MSSFEPERRRDGERIQRCGRRREQAAGEHRPRRPRQAGGDQARPGRAGLPGACAPGGRAGDGEDRPCAGARAEHRRRVAVAHPVHARPPADGRHRPLGLQPARAGLRVPARADLRERRPRRRDQPRDAEDAVLAARGHGRDAGHRRRRHARAARSRSSCWRRRTRSSSRGPSRCRRPSSTASSSRRRSAIRQSDEELQIVRDQRHGHPLGRPRAGRLARRGGGAPPRERGGLRRRADPALGHRPRPRHARARHGGDRRLGARQPRARARRARLGAPARPRLRRFPRTSRSSSSPSSATGSSSRRPSSSRSASTAGRRRRPGSSSSASRWPRGRRPHSAARSFRSPVSGATDLTFPLVPRRRLIGLAFGAVTSVRRGTGSDVASSRPYQPGDDVDTIDWAASARLSSARGTDEFIVRERYAEEAPRVVIVADRRPAMSLYPAGPALALEAGRDGRRRKPDRRQRRQGARADRLPGLRERLGRERRLQRGGAVLAPAARPGRLLAREGVAPALPAVRGARGQPGAGVRAPGADAALAARRDLRLHPLRLPLAAERGCVGDGSSSCPGSSSRS